ncbi:hypothetical protein OGAPHI_005258 [Ogataea philodendri]|uniref:Kynureninase n=1 Tax=Ogataea philodendri TaxID=1378263 RepID=A0A9P8P220_9ASCO|nr:uncharacterized protein OGAPHI_005258 [Ogataea philodendri]KAH3663855.1 hypothetical protein OGAPHI_005258 [Ogataea philodendri]
MGSLKASELDAQFDCYNDKFVFPTFGSMGLEGPAEEKVNYLCGNSLGLMPKSVPRAINDELDAWAARGVESHFRHPNEGTGGTAWMDIDLPVVPLLAPIVGAKTSEVACMGTLTMNLNSLLCAFYKPTSQKYKILFEKGAFPSDYYAFLNMVKLHGYSESALIQIEPRENEFTLRTQDILDAIDKNAESLALVCLPGIQYYTGQYFEIEKITAFAQSRNCVVGWDLAHAVGNVDLKLHDWNVDFAAWCSYKYLNAGPGAIGGIFVHEKHCEASRPRLAGWWGNNAEERFKMLEKFTPIESALGFRQSNPSVIDVVSLKASLTTMHECGGINKLRVKSMQLTRFLESLLRKSPYYRSAEKQGDDAAPHFVILTPSDPDHRGAQLSLLFKPESVMDKIFSYLNSRGVICDERRPDVIRLAPTPAYNSFLDCEKCVTLLNHAFSSLT